MSGNDNDCYYAQNLESVGYVREAIDAIGDGSVLEKKDHILWALNRAVSFIVDFDRQAYSTIEGKRTSK